MLREFLELQGFSVATVHDGETALVRVAEAPPDLVVLDVMLPGISGFEVLKRLRETPRPAGGHADGPWRGSRADHRPAGRRRRLPAKALQSPGAGCAHPGGAEALPRWRVGRGPEWQRAIWWWGRSGSTSGAGNCSPVKCPSRLTAAEMRVLEHLMRRPGEVLSRARLTELALDRPIEAYDRSIDTLVSKLRRKLSAAGVAGDCIRGAPGPWLRARSRAPPGNQSGKADPWISVSADCTGAWRSTSASHSWPSSSSASAASGWSRRASWRTTRRPARARSAGKPLRCCRPRAGQASSAGCAAPPFPRASSSWYSTARAATSSGGRCRPNSPASCVSPWSARRRSRRATTGPCASPRS